MRLPWMIVSRTAATGVLSFLALTGCMVRGPQRAGETWSDPSQWHVRSDGSSTNAFHSENGPSGPVLAIDYELRGSFGWIELARKLDQPATEDIPVTFLIKAEGSGDLELKLVDADGSVFGKKIPLPGAYTNWTPIVFYKDNTEYWWGGDDQYSGLSEFQLAISGHGAGKLLLDGIGLGQKGMRASFPHAGPLLDPDRELPGTGFRQRRSAELIPEDPLVLEWLKQVQDVSSPDRKILPSMENNEAQTFNNALVAMAFILKGEKERAERILDFFAAATVRTNADPTLQNFFYKGEARGFFQAVNLNATKKAPALHTFKPTDRWMGDMAWLLIAYEYYGRTYGMERYREIHDLLKQLLISWYKDATDGPGGYVQHGWRNGDAKLHETFGHPEGNIDCYAVFQLCGEPERAAKIKIWLDRVLKGYLLPLDQYTWRVQAFGKDYARLLDIPDYDLRYRKIFTHNGRPVMGLYDHVDATVTNSWLDGVGQIACAYIAAGNKERGYFYANQLDAFIIERVINGVRTHTIPYTANGDGGYDWVEPDRGFISVAAWYIFAKNRFDPMTLTRGP